jgi:hypothetical protein
MTMPPPEKLETKRAEMPRVAPFQFFASLHHFRSGWRANHALERTAPGRFVSTRRSLSAPLTSWTHGCQGCRSALVR